MRIEDAKLAVTILQRAVYHFGSERQVDKCIEEMSELTKALLKFRQASADANYGTHVGVIIPQKEMLELISEIVDVEYMLEQMHFLYVDQISGNEKICSFEREQKLGRLLLRIENTPECDYNGRPLEAQK